MNIVDIENKMWPGLSLWPKIFLINSKDKFLYVAWALPMAEDFLEKLTSEWFTQNVAWALPMAEDFLAYEVYERNPNCGLGSPYGRRFSWRSLLYTHAVGGLGSPYGRRFS